MALSTSSIAGPQGSQQAPGAQRGKRIRRAVTGAVTNGGLIRLTTAAHPFATNDWVQVVNVGGVPNATGTWRITVISTTVFDLVGSTFAGAYTSGGEASRGA